MSTIGIVALALHGAACGASRTSAGREAARQAVPSAMTSVPAIDSVRPTFADRDSGNATVVLFAAASIRELRFGSQPEIKVRLLGALGDSVRVLERRNLPSPIVPGTTYRDVFVAVEILGHLRAQCISQLVTGAPPDSPAIAQKCATLTVRDTLRAPVRRP